MSGTYAEIPKREMDAMLARLRDQEDPIRREVLTVAAEALVSEAMVNSPVLTGALQASHTVFQIDDESALIGANTNYALVVHEGFGRSQRWFVRTIQAQFKRIFAGAIKLALDNAAGRAKQ